MRIHYLQHVPFEGPGSMDSMLRAQGHRLSTTRLYRDFALPGTDALDWLIVLGGPMSVHEDRKYPWLSAEKRFLEQVIAAGKTVLGICLGAQLIADVLGSRVYPNPHREIGWHALARSAEAGHTALAQALPDRFEAFHWHGETFDIPAGSTALAASEACPNQGFLLQDRVLGMQFHLEATPGSVRALVAHCGDELDGSTYVQSVDGMLADEGRFRGANALMNTVLATLGAR